MKLLLTSSGIKNDSLRQALERLLGKSIAESSALFVPTGMHPFPNGGKFAFRAMCGDMSSSLAGLGWNALSLFELTSLTSIKKDVWVSALEEADALLVWGGDPLYLAYWMASCGLRDVLRTLQKPPVYVGVSAGSMAVTRLIGETYTNPPGSANNVISSQSVRFETPDGEIERTFVSAEGLGLVDFSIIAHLNGAHHPDASMTNAEIWASMIPSVTYAIDDQSGVLVDGDEIEVVSEGVWRRFPASV